MRLAVFEREIKKTLKRTHLEQLMSYCYAAHGRGDYYGNEAQFRKRHDEIVKWLEDCLETLDKPK